MRFMMRMSLAALGLAASTSSSASAQTTHVVRLVANPSTDTYRFEPANVQARPNDVLVFQVVSGAPHSVVFEGKDLGSATRVAFNSAMPSRAGDLSSPLLTASGTEYRMTVPQVPPGSYPFYCLPHRAYDMQGTLMVR
jgi:plastocyanin